MKITFSLPTPLIEALKKEAAQDGRTQSEIVRRALVAYLEAKK